MQGKEFFFLKKKFAEHYAKNTPRPPEVARREFGFGWEKKIDYRHKAFNTIDELKLFMTLEAPFYASYSTAYYDLPAARPMERKGYLGSDLVFDIDLQYVGEKHEHNTVICPYCLNRAKQDATRLFEDFLLADFGFSKNEVSANYSGSKGYHLHVSNDTVKQLSANARSELVNYVSAFEVDANRLITGTEEKKPILRGPGADSKGWRKKVFDYATGFISSASLESFKELSVSAKSAEKMIEEKEFIVKKMGSGNWDAVDKLDLVWKKIVPEAIEKKKVVVDKPVTIDQARLIRIPDSIHGDTGLLAKKCDLKDFDPLKDALAFTEGFARVRTEEDARIQLKGETFEAKANVSTDMPMQAAVMLLCKKKAVLVEEYAASG